VTAAGCLALLWQLTRREGIGLFDLVGFGRTRLVRDALLGFALIPVSLAFILGGVYSVGWLLYGTLTPPYLFGPLPLPAALYGVLVFPFIWGLTEQMTYNGYLVPRFKVLCRTVRDRSCPDGWRERLRRRAASAVDAMTTREGSTCC
jgi:hypothetical protein